jgi:hypothetical protein
MKGITGWFIAGIAVAALIYLQICRTPKPVNTDDRYSILEKQKQDTVNYYEELLKANDAATELAVYKAEQAFDNQRKAEADLKVSTDHVSNLTLELKAARKEMQQHGYDDDWVAVSPRYINACDSLEVAADKQAGRVNLYIKSNDSLKTKLTDQETAYKNKLATQTSFNNALRNQLDSCQLAIKDNPSKKRSQLYAGINLLGNKTYFVDGGQVNLTLLTKRNTMFEVNGTLVHGQVYVGGGTKFLISFRKRP